MVERVEIAAKGQQEVVELVDTVVVLAVACMDLLDQREFAGA